MNKLSLTGHGIASAIADIKRHCDEKIQDLNYANGWSKTPEIVKQCRAAGHETITMTIGSCLSETSCRICNYKFKIDSSG